MRPEYLLIYEDKWKTWNKVCVYIKISGRKFVCLRRSNYFKKHPTHLLLYILGTWRPADRCYEENRIW